MGMTDGEHLDIEDQPERKSGRNLDDVKCVHRVAARGPGNMTWCELYTREAKCDSCSAIVRQQAEGRCHRKGTPVKIHYHDLHTGGTLRDAVKSKTGGPLFTKHHETVMPRRTKQEKMKQIMDIYGGVTPWEKYINKLKNNVRVAEAYSHRQFVQKWAAGWWKGDVTVAMQQRVAFDDYSKIEARLLERAGVIKIHDEFLIDPKEWVSPFTEGELVIHKGKLARVIKITGPLIKIRLQHRDYPKHLDVLDWELEKRSVIRWVVKLVKKLWPGILSLKKSFELPDFHEED